MTIFLGFIAGFCAVLCLISAAFTFGRQKDSGDNWVNSHKATLRAVFFISFIAFVALVIFLNVSQS